MSNNKTSIKPNNENKVVDDLAYLTSYNNFNFFEILGLNESEIKIMNIIHKTSKSAATISRLTKIPKTSINYSLKKLYRRKLIKPVRRDKRLRWISDILRIIRAISNLPTPSRKDSTW
jgi:DNA-binding MarR family transcriptional regulator